MNLQRTYYQCGLGAELSRTARDGKTCVPRGKVWIVEARVENSIACRWLRQMLIGQDSSCDSRPDGPFTSKFETAVPESDQDTDPLCYSPSILQVILQRSTAKDLGPPPDGGRAAWTQVVMSHLINFNAFGYLLSFGIFQDYYTDTLGYSKPNVSWVGTVGLFLVYFMAAFSGRAMDAGFYRLTLECGLALQLLGVFMTSLSTEYWQLLLSQGICQGIGNGLLFCPAVALVSTYFSAKRRAVAVAWVACGGATGGIVFPAIAQSLLGRIGFAWTVRVMGFVMLFNAILVITFSRTRLPPRKTGPFVDWDAFREPTYVLSFWGLFFAYYYIRSFGQDVLDASDYSSFSLLLLINGMGAVGRLVPALVSDRFFGPVNTIVPCIFFAGMLLFCWIAVRSLGGLYAWVATYGFFGGGVQSLALAASTSFTPDLEKIGIRMGMVFTIVSFACLSGPPIGGRLVEVHDGGYLLAQVFSGMVVVGGSLLLVGARLAKTGIRFQKRV
jgi:MFS family permease